MKNPASLRMSTASSLREEDERLRSSANLLALLFRQINADLTIDAKGWSRLMERYLTNELNHYRIPQTSRGRSSERSNLSKGLSVPGMTLLHFMRGLQVINPHAIEWEFILETKNGEVSAKIDMDQTMLFQEYHNTNYPDRPNPLAIAWRELRSQCLPEKDQWRKAFNAYLANPENGVILTGGADGQGRRNSERGNLTKALDNPDMTIKVFSKGIRIINPNSIRSNIKLIMRPGGRVTEHSVTVITNQLSMLENEE